MGFSISRGGPADREERIQPPGRAARHSLIEELLPIVFAAPVDVDADVAVVIVIVLAVPT